MSQFVTKTTVISTLVVLLSSSFLVYIINKKKRKDAVPTAWKKIGYVKNIYLFPLKSGHYMDIDIAECTTVGLRLLKNSDNPLQLRDRSFVVYGQEDNEIKCGVAVPVLVKINVSVHDEYHIALDAPEMKTLYVKIPDAESKNRTNVRHWSGEEIQAIDCGEEAAQWLSHFVAQKNSCYRLGYYNFRKKRNVTGFQKRLRFYKYMSNDATGLYSEVTSILLVNQASVNDYLKRAPGANVTPINFRPNIVIDGPDVIPYDEDNWQWIKIGDVIMRNVKDCTRCIFTAVDQDSGIRNSNREPLTSLSKYRMSKNINEKAPVMGIHTDIKKTGIIKSRDEVYIGKSQ